MDLVQMLDEKISELICIRDNLADAETYENVRAAREALGLAWEVDNHDYDD